MLLILGSRDQTQPVSCEDKLELQHAEIGMGRARHIPYLNI